MIFSHFLGVLPFRGEESKQKWGDCSLRTRRERRCSCARAAGSIPLPKMTSSPRSFRVAMAALISSGKWSIYSCMQLVGWRYEIAKEESQKYKEGMFILEKERMEKKGG
ncbi:unnamed protein product [Linum trigynum]|uniref:Yippee domain-containing protein n=1 Tax=Linum trigynum TaxID=586398 RepID=A0AAV2C7N8_9ROSI